MVRLLVVVSIVCLCVAEGAQLTLDLYEGDVCDQDKGTLWTCKHHKQCPKAAENFRNGITPKVCGFQGKDPIVCCEPEVKLPQGRGAKANAKCKEYAKSVYIYLPDPLDDKKVNEIDTCAAVEPLIINGVDAKPREYPHMALIGFGPKEKISWACGGSLVSERFIISAAHCTSTSKGPAKWARLGDYNIQSRDDDIQGLAQSEEYEIIDRVNHPNYKEPSVYFDIALYKLDRDVVFNEFIRPICLQTNHQFQKTYAIATGWGHTEWRGRGSDVLQKVNLTLTQRKRCSDEYKLAIGEKLQNGIQDQAQLCAGDIKNGKDTCQGDSGGPLQLRLKEPHCMYALVGVTSFGARCGGDKPGVYTRVSNYVPWIESVVWP